ncbi:hypothetical protein EOD39_13160 [Acipenser ruthenus]|uniref:Uncharacterized protein n=1 Tax=Acipenser ruthenus TaxID=7906 RepID=A0A662YRC8_ACIRT|nr:hypothetical protein EOD39_13160 [Acipenser ruthenus]
MLVEIQQQQHQQLQQQALLHRMVENQAAPVTLPTPQRSWATVNVLRPCQPGDDIEGFLLYFVCLAMLEEWSIYLGPQLVGDAQAVFQSANAGDSEVSHHNVDGSNTRSSSDNGSAPESWKVANTPSTCSMP